MRRLPSFDRINAGDGYVSSLERARLTLDRVVKLSVVQSSGALAATGPQVSPASTFVDARLTGRSGSAYSWVESRYLGGGNWEDKGQGISGTLNAYEYNGGTTSTGRQVRLRRASADGDTWVFRDVCCTGGSPGSYYGYSPTYGYGYYNPYIVGPVYIALPCASPNQVCSLWPSTIYMTVTGVTNCEGSAPLDGGLNRTYRLDWISGNGCPAGSINTFPFNSQWVCNFVDNTINDGVSISCQRVRPRVIPCLGLSCGTMDTCAFLQAPPGGFAPFYLTPFIDVWNTRTTSWFDQQIEPSAGEITGNTYPPVNYEWGGPGNNFGTNFNAGLITFADITNIPDCCNNWIPYGTAGRFWTYPGFITVTQ